jgi:hypothetical protein
VLNFFLNVFSFLFEVDSGNLVLVHGHL